MILGTRLGKTNSLTLGSSQISLHQCGPGSITRSGFSPATPVCFFSQKSTFPNSNWIWDVVKEDALYECTSISYLSNLVAYNDAVAASLCLLRVKCQTFHGGDDIFNFHPGHRGHGRYRGNRVTAITRGSKNKTSAALKWAWAIETVACSSVWFD